MKEPNALPDLQLSKDVRGIALEAVGIRSLELPVLMRSASGSLREVAVEWSAAVSLAAALRGTHMSRFVDVLSEFGAQEMANLDLSAVLSELRQRLQCSRVELELRFQHFIAKVAPVTGSSAPAPLSCRLRAVLDEGSEVAEHRLSLELPASNLCPCSKAISEHGAHNQRIYLRVEAALLSAAEWKLSSLDSLAALLEDSASAPVYPFLKRGDEKFVTERQYENAKFVEDVVRDAVLRLRDLRSIGGFSIEVEALESIHAHNAWARHSESLEHPRL